MEQLSCFIAQEVSSGLISL